MRSDDFTDIGGVQGAFLTTHWSIIEQCSESGEEDKDKALIGLLLRRYWKPVYCYARRRGYSNEYAKDLTQGFFHEIVLGRRLFQKADHAKGRFRSYLLTALKRYLSAVYEKDTAQKRRPKGDLVSLDSVAEPEMSQMPPELDAEESFNYAWVSALLEQVLEEVEAKCYEDGKTVHWYVFYDRVVSPIMENRAAPSMQELCSKYGIADSVKGSNMTVTVKRRFQTALQKRIQESAASREEADSELEETVQFLARFAQDQP